MATRLAAKARVIADHDGVAALGPSSMGFRTPTPDEKQSLLGNPPPGAPARTSPRATDPLWHKSKHWRRQGPFPANNNKARSLSPCIGCKTYAQHIHI